MKLFVVECLWVLVEDQYSMTSHCLVVCLNKDDEFFQGSERWKVANVDEEGVVATWVNLVIISNELRSQISQRQWVMLEEGKGVESLDFKGKLEELLDGLGGFVKGKKRINKNRVKRGVDF